MVTLHGSIHKIELNPYFITEQTAAHDILQFTSVTKRFARKEQFILLSFTDYNDSLD